MARTLIPSLLIMLLIGVMVGLISRDGLSSMTVTANQDSLTVHRLSNESVQVECEDEREPVVSPGQFGSRVSITVTCKEMK